MSGQGPTLPKETLNVFAKAFAPLSEEEVAQRREQLRLGEEANAALTAWVVEHRGMLSILVETLASACAQDLGETLGHIKLHDDGGRCLGYLCDVVASLEKARRLGEAQS